MVSFRSAIYTSPSVSTVVRSPVSGHSSPMVSAAVSARLQRRFITWAPRTITSLTSSRPHILPVVHRGVTTVVKGAFGPIRIFRAMEQERVTILVALPRR
jgi:hypothetical protein